MAPEIEVEATETGLRIRMPGYRIVPLGAVGMVILLSLLPIALVYDGELQRRPVAFAVTVLVAVLAAAGCYRLRNRLYEPITFLDSTGIRMRQGTREISIAWSEARVDSYTHPGGVTVSGESGQKILLANGMRNVEIVEDHLLRYVPRHRIKFAKDWCGQESIFPRVA